VDRCCEHGNELLGSMKCWIFLCTWGTVILSKRTLWCESVNICWSDSESCWAAYSVLSGLTFSECRSLSSQLIYRVFCNRKYDSPTLVAVPCSPFTFSCTTQTVYM